MSFIEVAKFSSMPTGIHRVRVSVLVGSAIFLYVDLFTFWRNPFLLGGDQVYLLAEVAFNVNWLRVFVVSMPALSY